MAAAILAIAGSPMKSAAAASPVSLATGYAGLVNDAVFDSARGVVYASVPSTDPRHPNQVIAFSPTNGAVQWSVFAGSEPNHLALASDGSTLHVGLDGANSVAQIDLTTRLLGSTFGLGSSSRGPYEVVDMIALPGSPGTVVVSLASKGLQSEVMVFDDGVARSAAVSGSYGATSLVAANGSTVYGYEGQTSGYGYTTFALDAGGITTVSTMSTAIVGFSVELIYDAGRVYASSGHVIDGSTGTTVATMSRDGGVAPAVAGGVVWFVDDREEELIGYSTTTFAQVDAPFSISLAGGSARGVIDTSAGLLIWTDRGYASVRSQPTDSRSMTLNGAIASTDGTVIYGSVGADSPQHANSVVALDAATLAVRWSVWVGSEPDVLARSDDGSKLYVGLLGGGSVARVDLSSRTVDLDFSIPHGSSGPRAANDIEVLPGSTATVAVSMKLKGGSPHHDGVAVFDLGVMRPGVASSSPSSNVIEFATAETAYGFDNSSTGFTLQTLAIDADGITRSAKTSTAIRRFGTDIAYDNGRLYGSNGVVVDPVTGATLGTFSGASSKVRPEVRGGSVHLLSDGEIQSFNTTTFVQSASQAVVEPAGTIRGFLTTSKGHFVWTDQGFGYASAAPPATVAGGGAIKGRVTDAVTGRPIHSVCVVIVDETDTDIAVTDNNGDYSIVLTTGTYYVGFAECEYYEYFAEWYDDHLPADVMNADPVVVSDGQATVVNARLSPLFDDVTRGSTFFADIVWLRGAGITTGCSSTSYCPADSVTREQMAAFIARTWRLFGGTCESTSMPFGDVERSSFAYDDIACIRSLGITTGTSATTYSPHNAVTRQEMGAFLARLWVALGNTCSAGSTPFTDVAASSFARDAISCIYSLEITTGTSSTTYSPHDPVTREQMAAFIARLGRLVDA